MRNFQIAWSRQNTNRIPTFSSRKLWTSGLECYLMAVSFLIVLHQRLLIDSLFLKQSSLEISKLLTSPILLSDKDQILLLKNSMRLAAVRSLFLLSKEFRTPTQRNLSWSKVKKSKSMAKMNSPVTWGINSLKLKSD